MSLQRHGVTGRNTCLHPVAATLLTVISLPFCRHVITPTGVEVRLVVPSLFELPSRVSPPGASMDGSKHTLVWQQQQLQQQAQDASPTPRCFSAVFLVSAGEAATQAAMRVLSADVVVRGRGGATLTGATLHQYGFSEGACAQACSWEAHVTAKLAHL